MRGMHPLCQEPEARGQGPALGLAGWREARQLCLHTHRRVIHQQGEVLQLQPRSSSRWDVLGSTQSHELPHSTLFLIAQITRNVIFVLSSLSHGCWRCRQGGASPRTPAGSCLCLSAHGGVPACVDALSAQGCVLLSRLSVCLWRFV